MLLGASALAAKGVVFDAAKGQPEATPDRAAKPRVRKSSSSPRRSTSRTGDGIVAQA